MQTLREKLRNLIILFCDFVKVNAIKSC